MQLIIFGAPGVGKGTQAKIIAEKLSLAHISTGDILREAVAKGTEMGLKAKAVMDSGNLVSDEIVAGIIKDVLQDERCNNGYILDGFPRTLAQAKMLDVILTELSAEQPTVLSLKADDKLIIDRLSSRRSCNSCGAIFTVSELKDMSLCPKCGAKDSLVKRRDDQEEVIKNRLSVFHQATQPVLDYYEGKADIICIEAAHSIEQVSLAIFEALGI